MKDVIYSYYNMFADKIDKSINDYFFYYNKEMYIFCEVLNDIDVVRFLYEYINDSDINCYNIILNNNNDIITRVNNKNYSLIKIVGIVKYEVKPDEFVYYPINKEPLNWGEIWGNRLDYYEIQLRELGIKYQSVLNCFGFFAGLAENAINYYNLTLERFKDEGYIVGIVHNRMKYPCYMIDYNNPLNFVIDYSVRDISEYIKSYLINKDYDLNNVLFLLDNLNLNNLMFNLLYSRLLYPTFYFDIYDKIILDDGVDSDIINILDCTNKYIGMLNNIFLRYKDRYKMFNIEWINKKM